VAKDERRGLSEPARWRELFQGRRGRLTAGLLLLEALVAVETLVVTTIMPDVQRDLGDLHLYGWAGVAFSLATFATIPLAGHAVDRYRPARPLSFILVVYVAGLLVAAAAPSMLVLVLGRFIQGCGAGGLYTLSFGTVAKSYPERLRGRVLALLASMWILPGLVGPPVGTLIASTIGWRYAFLAPLPVLLVSGALIFPALGDVPSTGDESIRLPVRWPIQLMVGAGLFLAGLTSLTPWTPLLLVMGAIVGVPALGRIVPAGTFTARPGLPAAAAAAFLLSFSFFAVDWFVTLMLTDIRGLSLGWAGVVVTLMTVSWALGSWWQSRDVNRVALGTLVRRGTAFVMVGIVGLLAGLSASVPIGIVYAAWTVAGLGMGIAFPTIPLAVMNEAVPGTEASQLSSTLLTDTLGMALGAGLAGSSIALLDSLRAGLAGAFTIGFVGAILLLVIAGRIPTPDRKPDSV
jgi:MFS family permease